MYALNQQSSNDNINNQKLNMSKLFDFKNVEFFIIINLEDEYVKSVKSVMFQIHNLIEYILLK